MRRFFPCLLLLSTVLAACALRPTPMNGAAVAYAAEAETATAIPTASSLPSATPEPSETPTSAPTATLTPVPTATPIVITCAEPQGTVERISVPSPTLDYPIDALIYLPPCYYSTFEYYPVLYLIHGLNYQEDQWVRLGAPAAADVLSAAGEIAPLIIVMPRDRLDARLDTAFVNDLVPYIDANYRTRSDRLHRAIGGLSRGGGWAVHIGLQYPGVFGRIGAHSPAVFYGDEGNIRQWARDLPADQHPAVYLDIGQDDSLAPSASWLDQVLTWFQVTHTYVFQPGAHNEEYWSAHVADYLRFYATDWRSAALTPVPEADAIAP